MNLSITCSLANLVAISVTNKTVPVLFSYLLEPVTLLAVVLLSYYNHTRARTASTTILLFWPLYLAGLLLWVRTIVLTDLEGFRVILAFKCAVVGFGLLSHVLESFSPECGPELSLDDKTFTEHPLLTANIFSVWTFAWMTPLMKKGTTQFITEDDLPSLKSADESQKLGAQLQTALTKHTLWKALFVAYGRPYATAAGLKILQDLLAYLQPQLLRWLLSFISWYQMSRLRPGNEKSPPLFEGFFIAAIMFIAAVVQTITLHQYFQRAFETGMRVRAGLVTCIFSKALALSNDARGAGSGDIVNLMSVDATRLQDFCTYGLIAISGPFQIVLAFISLYNLLGWSAFVGVAVMILSIPLNTFIAGIMQRLQKEQMKNRDKRTRLMSELLANIRSIKLYAWEYSFIRKILETRNDQELKMLRKIGTITALNVTLWGGVPLLVAFSSFATAALMSSSPLTPDIIFPAMSLFLLLQFPLAMFAMVTSNLVEAVVSIKRLSTFLDADELQPDARKMVERSVLTEGDQVLSIRNADFSWSNNSADLALEDINLLVKKGELVGVLGRVGSGKTSLLSAIIGEMTRCEGEVILSGSIAYAPQSPWIMSASVRENILFSHEFDETFYNLVVEACALGQDFSALPQGDLTEVGEKGITLSGGQRARISLARAVYARSDLVLLDDCLAAVDSHVARHIFDHVIGPHGLLATKARILVTNSVTFLKHFHQLLFLRRSIILESGSYESLMANTDGEFYKLVTGHGSTSSSSGTSTPYITSGSLTPSEDVKSADQPDHYIAVLSEKLPRKRSFTKARLAASVTGRISSSTGLTKEHIEHGRVKLNVYLQYIESASKVGSGLFLLATALQQAASVCATLVLRDWGEHNREAGANTEVMKYLIIYGLFSFSSTILGGVSAIIIWVYCALRSAKRLHEGMLYAIMRAPLNFFELTPTGRILNLFSRDTYVVDQLLVRDIQGTCRTLAICLSIIAVIGGNLPPFLFAVIPLGWFYVLVMKYYLATSRELKRLDSVSRSPIFAWFSESLAGLSTIRAFNQQSIFNFENQRRVDRNQICYLPTVSVNRWLAIRLEFVGALIVLIVALLSILALITTGVDAGLVGLVLSYALNMTSSLNWVVRSASSVEQNIVSVERILHQTSVEPEAPQEIPDNKPEGEWPRKGEVEFRDYSTRYRQGLDLVLRSVSMTIKAKEKIGVCGRTGAGKSSLLLALFRIIEPVEGTIFIDDVDISHIGLHDLRSAISIVPQSPDLFEGTLRENVDPVGEYADADIWNALTKANLKDYVDTLPEGLDAPIREGGSSLSAGQRQLLCFARALLRKSKILVLDEATSAVDLDTDKAIQNIIRGPAFADVTILTIAHRLHTIMESDRILVMDAGKVAELDSPANLLSKETSIFHSLVSEAGLLPNAP